MPALSAIFNGILVGASGYALYCIVPDKNPYAFSACAFGLCHGLLGLISGIKGDGECSKIHHISSSVMEILPLPLINIELYLASSSSEIALGHALFIIPLAFDLIAKLFTEEGEDSSTETLRDLTILGNIVSLLFLTVNEDNYIFGAMALIVFISKYGANAIESFVEGACEYVQPLAYAVLFVLTTLAVAS